MKYNMRLVRPGERYGRDHVLVNEYDDVLVEFYDADYAGDERFGELGQFVSRYMLSTLRAGRNSHEQYGVDLEGGVPKWKLTAEQMREVHAQLEAA